MITELKIGDYIERSELDTEQKYNDVVEVFRQWGFEFKDGAICGFDMLRVNSVMVLSCNVVFICLDCEVMDRKLTYDQVMSLKKVDVDNCNIDKVVNPFEQMVRNKTERDGESLKRAFDSGNMDAVKEVSKGDKIVIGPSETFREDANYKEMVKSTKASLAMESLGYEYDEDKQRWFRREYL